MKQWARDAILVVLASAGGAAVSAYLLTQDGSNQRGSTHNSPVRKQESELEKVTFRGDALRINPVVRPIVNAGNEKLRNGDGAGAEREYQRVTELDPTSADAWAALAVSQDFQGKFAAAEQNYRKALELDPQNARSLNGMALFAYRKRSHHEAIALLRRVLAAEPGNTAALWNIALAYESSGQFEAAIQHFKLYLGAGPEPTNAAYARAQIKKLSDLAQLRAGEPR